MNLKLNLDEYENIIIYKSLTDEKYLANIIDYIEPPYLKDKNIRSIFEIIKEFYKTRGAIPSTTELRTYLPSAEALESFKIILRNISNIDKNLNEDALIDNTERYIKERAIYHTMLAVAEEVGNGNVDTSFILDSFEKSCNINLKMDMGLNLIKDIDKVIKDLNVDQPMISSKWKWLDEKLGGGFLRNGRAIYVFAGETNIGKSIFLGNLATNIAQQGNNVLLISLEMSEMIYARRLVSGITQIPISDLTIESGNLKAHIDKLAETNPECNLIIKEFPPSTITPVQVKAFIKSVETSTMKFDAIIVDYVNLLKSTEGTNSYERVKYAMEQLRALSYVFKCPFITATQLNRDGYNIKNPGLDTISESIGLAATADVVVSIFQDEEDKELGIIKLGMMKNRFGPNFGSTSMKMDYNTLTASEDESINDTPNDSMNTLQMLSKK